MSKYAENTTVAPEKTRAEIEKTLARYQATQFMSGWDGDRAFIGFKLQGRLIRFILTLPSRGERRFTHTAHRGQLRSQEEAFRAWEQGVRQNWRALLLCIKAKLESVENHIESLEEAFMPHIVLPGGKTMAETILPQLDEVYRTGGCPVLLQLPAPKEIKEVESS